MSINKLLIISIDALNAKDIDYIRQLEHFQPFFDHGSIIQKVDAVYPTLTYCCHTSIMTGCNPSNHGVFHNEIMNPDYPLKQDWFWHKSRIKKETLFDVATKAGLKTGAIFWPVMADAGRFLTYNLPEIWSVRGGSNLTLFLKNGSKNMLPFVLRHQHKLNGIEQPQLDDFAEAVAISTIRWKKPDLLAVHLTEVDTIRHYNGLFSPKAYQALDSINTRIGHIIEALKDAGTYSTTNIILLGDHGGNDFNRVVLINSLFQKEKLLSTDENGRITKWDAYANGAGGSVQIHIKNPGNSLVYNRIKELFNRLSVMPGTPIRNVYTLEEANRKFGLFGSFSFVLEAKDGFIFRNHIADNWIVDPSIINEPYSCDHGFLPSHPNLKTMLLAKGPDIQVGKSLEHARLIDEGPTFAKLLDLQLPQAEGNVLHSILR